MLSTRSKIETFIIVLVLNLILIPVFKCQYFVWVFLLCLLISLIVCIGFEQTNFCPWDKMNRIWLGQDSWYNCRKVLEEVPIVTKILPTVIEALLFNILDEFEGSFLIVFSWSWHWRHFWLLKMHYCDSVLCLKMPNFVSILDWIDP